MTDNLKKSKQIFFKVGAVLLLFIAVTIACFSLVKVTCYEKIMIDGESMAPTLNDGDYGYMLKKNLIGEINRFDIIIFEIFALIAEIKIYMLMMIISRRVLFHFLIKNKLSQVAPFIL